MTLKLSVLVDNNTLIDRYFLGEPAVSYFLEIDSARILFDTGYSDVFLKNAKTLGAGRRVATPTPSIFSYEVCCCEVIAATRRQPPPIS